MDDQSIVSLFWARTDRAIAETQVKYGPYCTRIARNILSDSGDSEETVSDTWLAAWNAIPPDRPASLAPYLGRITRNLALNRLKARQADKRGGGALPLSLQELEECIPAFSRLEEGVEARELGEQIGEFLRREPGEARKIFVLRYFYCESVSDIAKSLGCTQSKVKSALARTRDRLRRFLQEEGLLYEG